MGNKCDVDENQRMVPFSKGQALANEFGIKFFETSAKSNTNVEEVGRCSWARISGAHAGMLGADDCTGGTSSSQHVVALP